MFLEEYPHLEVGGLHHPLILQEMFLQAAHAGRRETEWMVCWGHQHSLLHLDPWEDVTAIQSVGPWSRREEIQDLDYQVYKLRRLPRSLLCGPEWADALARDIVSSLKNCPRQNEDELSGVAAHPMQSGIPRRERECTLAEVQLAKAREAQWKALVTTMALEEEIEWLHWSITRDHPGTHIPSQRWDWQRRRSKGQSRRHHKALPDNSPCWWWWLMPRHYNIGQYWTEWANLPVHLDDCPLAMSVIELM